MAEAVFFLDHEIEILGGGRVLGAHGGGAEGVVAACRRAVFVYAATLGRQELAGGAVGPGLHLDARQPVGVHLEHGGVVFEELRRRDPEAVLSRRMSYGVSMMLMFSQHLLKQAMPLWQRNWRVSSRPSLTGTTGLDGRGSLTVGSLKSWLMALPLKAVTHLLAGRQFYTFN